LSYLFLIIQIFSMRLLNQSIILFIKFLNLGFFLCYFWYNSWRLSRLNIISGYILFNTLKFEFLYDNVLLFLLFHQQLVLLLYLQYHLLLKFWDLSLKIFILCLQRFYWLYWWNRILFYFLETLFWPTRSKHW